jgi:hypothetical protein
MTVDVEPDLFLYLWLGYGSSLFSIGSRSDLDPDLHSECDTRFNTQLGSGSAPSVPTAIDYQTDLLSSSLNEFFFLSQVFSK